MSEKNFVSSALESLAVDFGVDGAYEAVQKDGLIGAAKNYAADLADDVKETAKGAWDKAKEVGGYLERDIGNFADSVGDLFASKEEKAAKAAEEAAQAAAAEAESEAQKKAQEEWRARLDKSYILHTALVTCDKAYTNEEINPSYLVLPESHGEEIHGLPVLTVADYLPDVNVLNFGICRSTQNPKVQEAARNILDKVQEESKSWTDKLLGLFVDTSKKDVCTDSQESLAAYCAAPCQPEFFTGWIDGKADVAIDEVPSLLGRCTLCCKYGGAIQIQSSGQPEE